ncbi:MAG: TRAP transporter small permease [Marinobacter sp.]|uniref:TRAP transporter small permease n=1 Tax=Marinobacter sp. TaxID=50741 RepID=UPI0034A00440
MLGMLKRTERAIDAIMQPIVFAAMVALIVVITLQIISRVFFTAVGWTEEVARFLLVWITFMAATLAFQRGRHIAVSFVVNALPVRIRQVARILAVAIALGFMIALVLIGYRYTQVQSFQTSASLGWSMTYVYSIIPVCGALMSWYAFVDLVELVAEGPDFAETGSDISDPPP